MFNAKGARLKTALIDAVVYEMEWRLLEDPILIGLPLSTDTALTLCDCDACTKDYSLY